MELWDWVVRLLNIAIIDLALSGDNAIVIGIAASKLPMDKRKFVILLGGGLAIGLRIVFTAAASLLMMVPYLSAVGGVVLLWVVYRMLKPDDMKHGAAKKEKEASTFREALGLIITADVLMSLDNVLAVAGSAHGNLMLLIIGLLISMPLLMVSGNLISGFIDKAKWLIWLGAAVIAFTAARMVLEDKALAQWFHVSDFAHWAIAIGAGLLAPAAIGYFFHLRRKAKASQGQV